MTLTETPNAGFTFTNWAGIANGTTSSTTVVLANQKNTVTAEFAPAP